MVSTQLDFSNRPHSNQFEVLLIGRTHVKYVTSACQMRSVSSSLSVASEFLQIQAALENWVRLKHLKNGLEPNDGVHTKVPYHFDSTNGYGRAKGPKSPTLRA